MDPHRVGESRIGYSRVGVIEPHFERIITHSLGKTVQVTRRARTVGAGDAETGHPTITWATSTIDAILNFGPSRKEDMPPGIIGHLDGVIYTADPLRYQDQFEYPVASGVYYEVVSPCQERRGLQGGFLFRRAAFKHIELM
jgi:hypothetical protein